MNAPHVALIGSGEMVVRAAQRNGFGTLLVTARQPLKVDATRAADRSLVIDYTDAAELTGMLRAVHQWRPLDHVYSFTELGQVPAALAAAALGVGGQPLRAATLARDKYAMRRHLAAAGRGRSADPGLPPATRYARCTGAAELLDFGATAGWPVVLKVADGVGKDGVRLVAAAEQAAQAFADLVATVPGRVLLAEEYHDGPEVSVETLSFGGRHHVLAVTDKEVGANLSETGHTTPSRLAPAAQEAVAAAAVALLDSIGVRNAICHTEIRYTGRGPRVIETHTRPGGDNIRDLLRLSAGVDIYDAFFRLLAGGTFTPPARPAQAAAVRFLTPPAGRVTSVTGLYRALQLPGVQDAEVSVDAGDLAPEPVGNDHRCGHVIAVGATPQEAAERADAARAAITIATRPERAGPPRQRTPGRAA
jgi:biotin carboxylase